MTNAINAKPRLMELYSQSPPRDFIHLEDSTADIIATVADKEMSIYKLH